MDFLIYVWQIAAGSILLAFAISVYKDGLGYVTLHPLGLAGIGAYGYAIGTTQLGWSPWPTFAVGALLGLLAGWVSAEMLRTLRGDMLTLVTFGLGVGLVEVFRYSSLTGGVYGIGGIPPLPLFFNGAAGLALVLACAVLLWHWNRSVGAATARSLRDDEWAATTLGASVLAHQRITGALSGTLAAVGGIYLAGSTGFIEPRDFLPAGLLVPLAATIAAAGRTPLVVAAIALAIVALSQGARFMTVDPVLAGPLTQILIALGLAILLVAVRLRAGRGTARPAGPTS